MKSAVKFVAADGHSAVLFEVGIWLASMPHGSMDDDGVEPASKPLFVDFGIMNACGCFGSLSWKVRSWMLYSQWWLASQEACSIALSLQQQQFVILHASPTPKISSCMHLCPQIIPNFFSVDSTLQSTYQPS